MLIWVVMWFLFVMDLLKMYFFISYKERKFICGNRYDYVSDKVSEVFQLLQINGVFCYFFILKELFCVLQLENDLVKMLWFLILRLGLVWVMMVVMVFVVFGMFLVFLYLLKYMDNVYYFNIREVYFSNKEEF